MNRRKTIFITYFTLMVLIFTTCSLEGDIEDLLAKGNNGLIVLGANVREKLAWVNNNAVEGGTYIIELNDNETITPVDLSCNKKKAVVIFRGIGGQRTLSLSTNGPMFTIDPGVTLILDNNIILQVRDNNNHSLVVIKKDAALIMNEGTRINGNTTTRPQSAGGVLVGGVFTMNGGEIINNRSNVTSIYINDTAGGGVYVYQDGIFIMNDGVIKNNHANNGGGVFVSLAGKFTINSGLIETNFGRERGGGICSYGIFIMEGGVINNNTAGFVGGGVFVFNTRFFMEGGTIFGNTAYSYGENDSPEPGYGFGGGIYLTGSNFIKNGGTIYGYTVGDEKSNKVIVSKGDSNVINARGHAIFVDSGMNKHRDCYSGPEDNLTSDNLTVAGMIAYYGHWVTDD